MVVEKVMKSCASCELVPPDHTIPAAVHDHNYIRTWPHRHDTNGGFGACITKTGK